MTNPQDPAEQDEIGFESFLERAKAALGCHHMALEEADYGMASAAKRFQDLSAHEAPSLDLVEALGGVLWYWSLCCAQAGLRPSDVAQIQIGSVEITAARQKEIGLTVAQELLGGDKVAHFQETLGLTVEEQSALIGVLQAQGVDHVVRGWILYGDPQFAYLTTDGKQILIPLNNAFQFLRETQDLYHPKQRRG